MAYDPPDSSTHPARSSKMPKSCARRLERLCCGCISYFPLAIVYGLTTWAVWVQTHIGFHPPPGVWTGKIQAFFGVLFYVLLNWSYSMAVFTDPGSTTSAVAAQYSNLPTNEAGGMTSFTVKSTGEVRFCKKCNAKKPDRAHHCSSCKRCVLKMDHHCPWLAACVGFRNYKPFLLFLIYTCLFCFVCFSASITWVWTEIINDVHFEDHLMPVNYILLSVLSGVIGLVLSGFTGWHIYLAVRNQTTIESLEKTRYLTPIRRTMQAQLAAQSHRNYVDPSMTEQLREIHANALPGITRPEEGEDLRADSPAKRALQQSFSDIEHLRERTRYDAYLDEQDSEKLPNAFDRGWRANLTDVFGPSLLLGFFPIPNTPGDGFRWTASQAWLDAREDLARERAARARENVAFESERGWHRGPVVDFRANTQTPPVGYRARSPLVQPPPMASSARNNATATKYESSSSDDEEDDDERPTSARDRLIPPPSRHHGTANWNDLPQDMVGSSGRRTPVGARRYARGETRPP